MMDAKTPYLSCMNKQRKHVRHVIDSFSKQNGGYRKWYWTGSSAAFKISLLGSNALNKRCNVQEKREGKRRWGNGIPAAAMDYTNMYFMDVLHLADHLNMDVRLLERA